MTLYVGNINYQTSEQELEDTFAQFGNVTSVKVIKDKFTGRSKGFGFIDIEDKEGAEKAIAELNGKEVLGRTIKVSEAYPRKDEDQGPAPAQEPAEG